LLLDPHREPIPPTQARAGVARIDLRDRSQALAWFTAEHAVLLAAIDQAAAAGADSHTWQLARTLTTFFDRRGHWHDRAYTQRAALAAASTRSAGTWPISTSTSRP
jgi:hypothetical protein